MDKITEMSVGASLLVPPGISALEFGYWKTSYPLCTLSIFKDRFVINMPVKRDIVLLFSDIVSIKYGFFTQIIITARQGGSTYPVIRIGGIFNGALLFKRLKKVIETNKLPVSIG